MIYIGAHDLIYCHMIELDVLDQDKISHLLELDSCGVKLFFKTINLIPSLAQYNY